MIPLPLELLPLPGLIAAFLWMLWRGYAVPVGYVAEQPEPRLNLDRHGMPRDYATYVWLLYRKRVPDDSPERRAFLDTSDFPAHMGAYWTHGTLGTTRMR